MKHLCRAQPSADYINLYVLEQNMQQTYFINYTCIYAKKSHGAVDATRSPRF